MNKKFELLLTFFIGATTSAIAIGAVSIVNASGDATIKACANKSSGAMRYLSKGSCAKNETALSWNQVGPQGAQGPAGVTAQAGATGERGPAGPKGDTGAPGSAVRYEIVDASHAVLGPMIGADPTGYQTNINGRTWLFDNSYQTVDGQLMSGYYEDAACSSPLAVVSANIATSISYTFIDYGSNARPDSSDRAYETTGSPLPFTTAFANVYQWTTGQSPTCTAMLSADRVASNASGGRLMRGNLITKPTVVFPVSITEQ
jgi:hypothetical protein